MKGRQMNPAFFRKEQTKQPSSSLATKLRNARSSASLNLSSSVPALTEIPAEAFALDSFLEPNEKFWEIEPLKSLDVSFNRITAIPPEVGNLVDCTSMKFRDNLIECVPDSLFQHCTSLRHLNLDGNGVSSLSEAVLGLSSLKELLLNENRLQELPATLFELSSLRQLEVRGNSLRSLPSTYMWNLPCIQVLNLSSNALRELPGQISTLLTIETLNCSKNNLSSLPDLAALTALKCLDASQNQLVGFPVLPGTRPLGMAERGATGSSSLTHLILSYNKLSALDMTQLGVQKELCELLCANNALSALPEETEFLQSLKLIDVSNNNLRDLPSSVGWMSTLQKLRVDGNAIRTIRQALLQQASATELKKYLRSRGPSLLGIDTYCDTAPGRPRGSAATATTSGSGGSSTRSASLNPTEISDSGASARTPSAPALDAQVQYRVREVSGAGDTLNLSLLGLYALPIGLTAELLSTPSGSSITAVDLSGNSALRTIPIDEAFFQACPQLRRLNMSACGLGEVETSELQGSHTSSFFSPLSSLDLSKNKLTMALVDALLVNMNISELDLSSNQLTCIPLSLNLQSNLTTLRISHCGLLSLNDLDFASIRHLEELDVSNNRLESVPQGICSSNGLQSLSLENNNLSEIPLFLASLPVLRVLLLGGNPQRTVRANVLQLGSARVIEYLRNKSGMTTDVSMAAMNTPAQGNVHSTVSTAVVRNAGMNKIRVSSSSSVEQTPALRKQFSTAPAASCAEQSASSLGSAPGQQFQSHQPQQQSQQQPYPRNRIQTQPLSQFHQQCQPPPPSQLPSCPPQPHPHHPPQRRQLGETEPTGRRGAASGGGGANTRPW